MRAAGSLSVLVPAVLLTAHVAPAAADATATATAIFAFTDTQGVIHYSNVPADKRFRLVLAAPAEPREIDRRAGVSLERFAAYTRLIKGAAQSNRLEPALVAAVILAESGGDPRAQSNRGARGLMQLMPATARQYGVSNVFDPEENIRGGSRYLRDLVERYQNDLQLVLAAYNAGPEAVDRHGGIPPFRETLEYVPRVLQIYHRLLELTDAR
jgi:soluble lytic murein transglycosylase-like protein